MRYLAQPMQASCIRSTYVWADQYSQGQSDISCMPSYPLRSSSLEVVYLTLRTHARVNVPNSVRMLAPRDVCYARTTYYLGPEIIRSFFAMKQIVCKVVQFQISAPIPVHLTFPSGATTIISVPSERYSRMYPIVRDQY